MISESKKRRAEHLISVMEGLSGADVKGRCRTREDAVGRTMVAYWLLTEGWTEVEVGSVINRNHSTVNHYRGKMQTILHSPGWDDERELWEKFKEQI